MKLKLTGFILCIVFINGMAFGQEIDPDLYCGTVEEETQSKSAT